MVERRIRRAQYLNMLLSERDPTVLKLVTGMRGCGKAVLLDQYAEEASIRDPEASIIHADLGARSFRHIRDADALRTWIDDSREGGRAYVVLTDIARVEGWMDVIVELSRNPDTDVCIAMSNARLVAELRSRLEGRVHEVRVLPLSYAEYLDLRPDSGPDGRQAKFGDYLCMGALPYVDPDDGWDRSSRFLEGLYSRIFLHDIRPNSGIDVDGFDAVARSVMALAGKPCSSSMISEETGLAPLTVRKYIADMRDVYMLDVVRRRDVSDGRELKTLWRCYPSDTGFRNAVLGEEDRSEDLVDILVYWELRRRGYSVDVGFRRGSEPGFACTKDGVTGYCRLVDSMLSPGTGEEVRRTLASLGDCPKTVLSRDRFVRPVDGAAHYNVVDWLAGVQRKARRSRHADRRPASPYEGAADPVTFNATPPYSDARCPQWTS